MGEGVGEGSGDEEEASAMVKESMLKPLETTQSQMELDPAERPLLPDLRRRRRLLRTRVIK